MIVILNTLLFPRYLKSKKVKNNCSYESDNLTQQKRRTKRDIKKKISHPYMSPSSLFVPPLPDLGRAEPSKKNEKEKEKNLYILFCLIENFSTSVIKDKPIRMARDHPNKSHNSSKNQREKSSSSH
ncbi:hypothetical protein Dimus_014627 [Dionaea muscipula]